MRGRATMSGFSIFALLLSLCLRLPEDATNSMHINSSVDQSPNAPITYLALGDSYTIGESVPVSDRWSVQLVNLLRKQGVEIKQPDIIARTGWTTAELIDAIQHSGNTKKIFVGLLADRRQQSVSR